MDTHNYLTYRGRPNAEALETLPTPPAPPWRRFGRDRAETRGEGYQAESIEVQMVNAAIALRRPLLVTGRPGVGKSTLAYAVARELGLGEVLVWPITTRSTLEQGLYSYDALGRLQEEARAAEETKRLVSEPTPLTRIGDYMRLGPLGTAFFGREVSNTQGQPVVLPRVLLIDEIDKSDVDLPNELLHVFDEGEFEIRELARLPAGSDVVAVRTSDRLEDRSVEIARGRVTAHEFPIVILTSNGERDFPPAFLRRCLRLKVEDPDGNKLKRILAERLELSTEEDVNGNVRFVPGAHNESIEDLVRVFLERRGQGAERSISNDQLLNAVALVLRGMLPDDHKLRDALFAPLS